MSVSGDEGLIASALESAFSQSAQSNPDSRPPYTAADFSPVLTETSNTIMDKGQHGVYKRLSSSAGIRQTDAGREMVFDVKGRLCAIFQKRSFLYDQ